MSAADDRRPRVLSARLGANPNSSSLSVDVTLLLWGSLGSVAVGLVLSALLRGRKGKDADAPPPEKSPP